jgi:hypothetical protein
MLQAEDHLRVLYGKDSRDPGHNSCVRKHLMIVSGEAGEAISHSAHADPEKTGVFREIKSDVDALKNDIGSMSVSDALVRIREVRKKAETLDPKYDTSKCKACELGGDKWSDRLTKTDKYLNSRQGNNIIEGVEMKFSKEFISNVLTINGGQIVGRTASDVVAPYLDAQFTPGAQLPYRASTWFNIAGGVLVELLGYKFLKGNAKLGAVIVGSHMLSKVVNYAAEYSGVGASVARVSTVRPVAMPFATGYSSVASF